MKKLTAKKVYEKAVLDNYELTEDDHKILAGTHWQHKLHGTTPEPEHTMSFKSHFSKETVEDDGKWKSLAELADMIADKVEDKFGLHFSHEGECSATADDIRNYIDTLLPLVRCHADDKKRLIKSLNDLDNPHLIMVELYTLAG